MRKIEAIIRKSKFKEVKVGLQEAGFVNFTYHAVRSVSETSEKGFYRGVEYDAVASERIALSLVTKKDETENAIDVIVKSGQTQNVDDERILVYDLTQAYRIWGSEDSDKLIVEM